MKIIGITGGIGSGKSLIAKILQAMNFPIYYSDNRAKELMNENEVIRTKLEALFGNEAYVDGKLNRPYIAEQIFQDESKRLAMNEIVHPVVLADFRDWTNKQTTPFVFQESALLFETGNDQSFDAVILVTAPESIRIKRVMQRDNSTEEHVRSRIAAQMSEDEKRQKTPYIIENSGEVLLVPQVLAILSTLKEIT